jgi:hypothetical protein
MYVLKQIKNIKLLTINDIISETQIEFILTIVSNSKPSLYIIIPLGNIPFLSLNLHIASKIIRNIVK